MEPAIAWQPSLFEDAPDDDANLSFRASRRHQLDPTAWVDHVPGWQQHAGALFTWLTQNADWRTEEIVIHGQRMLQPRLLARWSCADGDPPMPQALDEMRGALAARYGRAFDSVGANLYRDGRDSVAWHGDRIARAVVDPVVAVLTLGFPRRFLLRPVGGRTALTLLPQPGDLVVMGGSSQRTWQHTVPKAARAGPRISVTFRHSTNDGVAEAGAEDPPVQAR